MLDVSLVCLLAVGAAKTPALPGNVTVKQVDLLELKMATDDAIQGKPFILEDKRRYSFWKGKFKPKPPVGLTDARNATSPVHDLFVQGAKEVAIRWELGQATNGKRLKSIEVWWPIEDSLRGGVNLKFAVRDRTSKKWRDITPCLRKDAPRRRDPQSGTGPGNWWNLASCPEPAAGRPRYVRHHRFVGARQTARRGPEDRRRTWSCCPASEALSDDLCIQCRFPVR